MKSLRIPTLAVSFLAAGVLLAGCGGQAEEVLPTPSASASTTEPSPAETNETAQPSSSAEESPTAVSTPSTSTEPANLPDVEVVPDTVELEENAGAITLDQGQLLVFSDFDPEKSTVKSSDNQIVKPVQGFKDSKGSAPPGAYAQGLGEATVSVSEEGGKERTVKVTVTRALVNPDEETELTLDPKADETVKACARIVKAKAGVDNAGKLAEAGGFTWRVTAQDGEVQDVTADYNPQRMNFEVYQDIVISCQPG